MVIFVEEPSFRCFLEEERVSISPCVQQIVDREKISESVKKLEELAYKYLSTIDGTCFDGGEEGQKATTRLFFAPQIAANGETNFSWGGPIFQVQLCVAFLFTMRLKRMKKEAYYFLNLIHGNIKFYRFYRIKLIFVLGFFK